MWESGEKDGVPLAGGWCATFAGFQADILEKVKQHRFFRNFNCNFFCEWCLCCRHMAFLNGYNFSDDADWKDTIMTQDQYRRSHVGNDLSPWHKVRGWTIFRNLMDLLHLIWLGIAKDVCGAELKMLAMTLYPGDSLAYALRQLWHQCKIWYQDRGVPCSIPCFTPNMLAYEDGNDYPSLASAVKGSTTKMIFLWLANKVSDVYVHGLDGSDLARRRAMMTWGLLDFVTTCDRGGLFLTTDEVHQAQHAGSIFLKEYQGLARDAYCAQLCLYKLRPKFHYFAHLLIWIGNSRENPRRHDLMIAEDFMGKLRNLGRRCHPRTISCTLLHRYCIFLARRWWKRCKT